MQHHGAPTRSLDWAESPQRGLIYDGVDALPGEYLDFLEADRPWAFTLPVAFKPIWNHERVHRQRGGFTLHGVGTHPPGDVVHEIRSVG